MVGNFRRGLKKNNGKRNFYANKQAGEGGNNPNNPAAANRGASYGPGGLPGHQNYLHQQGGAFYKPGKGVSYGAGNMSPSMSFVGTLASELQDEGMSYVGTGTIGAPTILSMRNPPSECREDDEEFYKRSSRTLEWRKKMERMRRNKRGVGAAGANAAEKKAATFCWENPLFSNKANKEVLC